MYRRRRSDSICGKWECLVVMPNLNLPGNRAFLWTYPRMNLWKVGSLRSRSRNNNGESTLTARESLDPQRSLWDLIAIQLRRHREERGLSGTTLGRLLGVDRSTVSRL